MSTHNAKLITDEKQVAEIIRRYTTLDQSPTIIGFAMGLSVARIRKTLRHHGVTLPKHGQPITLRAPKEGGFHPWRRATSATKNSNPGS